MTHPGEWGNMRDVYRVLPLQWWSSSPASRGVKVRQINRSSGREEEKQKYPWSAMSSWYECWCSGVEDSRQGSSVRGQDGGGKGAAVCHCVRSLQLSRPGEAFNSHPGHWASVQRLTGHQTNRKVSVLLGFREVSYKDAHTTSIPAKTHSVLHLSFKTHIELIP